MKGDRRGWVVLVELDRAGQPASQFFALPVVLFLLGWGGGEGGGSDTDSRKNCLIAKQGL